MTELKCSYHALLELMVDEYHMLVQLKDGQIKQFTFLMLNVFLTPAYLFW